MKRLIFSIIVLSTTSLLLAAAPANTTPPSQSGPDHAPGCEKKKPAPSTEIVDSDHRLTEQFRKKLIALKEAGKVTDPNTLSQQLTRTRHPLSDLPTAGHKSKTPGAIYKDHKQNVVAVGYLYLCGRCDKLHLSCATGFIIAPSGVIATNYHVVDNAKSKGFGIMTAAGDVYGIQEVLAADKNNDIAIVKVDADNLPAAALSAGAPIGSDVTVISHPAHHFYTLTRGIVSRYTQKRPHNQPVTRMEITADFARGSSGGPVFNDRGDIVGMVRATESIYYANKHGVDENLQMVIKSCIPAKAIMALIGTDTNSEK